MVNVMNHEEIPKESDWGNWEADVDQKSAYELYFGHSNAEMKQRYFDAPIEVASELQFMPIAPFRYHMLGFSKAVICNEGYDEMTISTAPYSFLKLIIYKLKNNKSDIEPIMNAIWPSIKYVVDNQKKYDADIDIYGDFSDLLKEIEELSAG
jgi:hypothetical protein